MRGQETMVNETVSLVGEPNRTDCQYGKHVRDFSIANTGRACTRVGRQLECD